MGCRAEGGAATGLAGQRWGTQGTWTTEHDSAPITRTSVCRWASLAGSGRLLEKRGVVWVAQTAPGGGTAGGLL
ncbi:MAG TPA: hypothetical protein VJ761_07085 [Ktedonobacteraceae bacterium]|nr:hypothetical protein [Ktedonobacteraceae bacterium]